jgi:hypothetical protein
MITCPLAFLFARPSHVPALQISPSCQHATVTCNLEIVLTSAACSVPTCVLCAHLPMCPPATCLRAPLPPIPLPTCLCAHLSMCPPATCLRAPLPPVPLPTCLRAHLPTCPPAYVPTCNLPTLYPATCPLAYAPMHLHTSPPVNLPTFVRAHLPNIAHPV